MGRGISVLHTVIVVLFILTVSVAVFFYLRSSTPVRHIENGKTEINSLGNVSSALPDGVSVVEKNGERYLRDERVGYEIEILNNEVLNNQNTSLFLYSSFENELPDINIFITDNPKKLNADEWIENFHEENYLLYFDSKKQIITQSGIMGYKVKEEGEIEHFSYHMILGDKVIIIDTPFDDKYENIIVESLKIN